MANFSRRSIVLRLLLGLFLTFSLTNARVIQQDHPARKDVILTKRDSCDIEGNTDLYGLGVRLGIYFQQLSSYLANTMLTSEITSSLAANAIFLFALLISMFKGSVDGSLRVIDGLVLLQLCFSYFFSVLSLFGYRTLLYQPSSTGRKQQHGVINGLGGFGTYFRLSLTGAVSAYAVWFWSVGIDVLDQSYPGDEGSDSGPCASVVWFFGSFKVHGGIKWALRAGSILATIYFAGLAIIALVTFFIWLGATIWEFATGKWNKTRDGRGFWNGMRREWRTSKNFSATRRDTKDKGRSSSESDVIMARHAHLVIRIINFCSFVWGIVAVELTLNVNHVQGVLGSSNNLYSAGQQLPMFIGAFSFIRVVWLIYTEWLDGGEEAEEVAIPLTPITPKTMTSAQLEDNVEEDGEKRGATSPGGATSFSDRLQGERNIVFALAAEYVPWLFSLDFLKGMVKSAANVHTNGQRNVVMTGKNAHSVEHRADEVAGSSNDGTAYQRV